MGQPKKQAPKKSKDQSPKKELQNRLHKYLGDAVNKMTVREMRGHLDRLKKLHPEDQSINNWGGRRNGAGQKKREKPVEQKLQEELEAHAWEAVDIMEKNQATNQVKIVKKERWRAIMDTLASKAVRNKDTAAAKEYLDRVWGKPYQSIKHSGSIDVNEQKLPTKAEMAAAEAYNRVLLEDE